MTTNRDRTAEIRGEKTGPNTVKCEEDPQEQPADEVSSLPRASPCRWKGSLPAEHAGSLHQKDAFVLNGNGFPFGCTAAHSLEKLQRDGATRLRLHALPPELELRVDGAVKQEVLMEALRVKCTDGGVVADLLGYESEP